MGKEADEDQKNRNPDTVISHSIVYMISDDDTQNKRKQYLNYGIAFPYACMGFKAVFYCVTNHIVAAKRLITYQVIAHN